MNAAATSQHEVPIFLRSGEDDLFGILTEPTAAPNGIAVLLAWGGGAFPSSGRNQIKTRLARQLAGRGFHALRTDYHGIAESSGEPPPRHVDRPYVVRDIDAWRSWLEERGLRRIALVGYCLGTRSVLAAAEGIEDLHGVGLIGIPVRDEDHFETAARIESLGWYAKHATSLKTLRKAITNPRKRKKYMRAVTNKSGVVMRAGATRLALAKEDEWASRRGVLEPLERLVERGTPLLLSYGTADRAYQDFERAREGRLGALIERAGDRATMRMIEADVNLQTNVALQDAVIDVVDDWLTSITSPRQAEQLVT